MDLDAAAEYIALDNPEAGIAFVQRVKQAVDLLATFPELGRPGRVSNTRELVVAGTRYIVPYRIRDHKLEILAVFHAARQWPNQI
jgi:toxin ParE1/3/4